MDNKVGELLKRFVPVNGTNLSETPMRYMDHTSRYAGEPDPKDNAWGTVRRSDPTNVRISSDQPYEEWLRNMAHEGAHSKLLVANNKRRLPEIDPELRDNIRYLLETDPKFLKEYLSHESEFRPFDKIPMDELDDRLGSEEIPAYLQAIEAMLPKGQMLEKSGYAKDLFHSDEQVDRYLRAVHPEGFINNRSADSFRPVKPKSKPWPGPLELFREMFQK